MMKPLRSIYASAVVWGVVYFCAAWVTAWSGIEPYGLFLPAIVAEGAAYVFIRRQSYRAFRWHFVFRIFTALCINIVDFYLWKRNVDFVDPETKLVVTLRVLCFIGEAAAIEACYLVIGVRQRSASHRGR